MKFDKITAAWILLMLAGLALSVSFPNPYPVVIGLFTAIIGFLGMIGVGRADQAW